MRNIAKAFLIILIAGTSVTLAEETNIPEKCNFAPTSKITNTPTGLVFRSGSEVQFSGTTSTPNNCSGSITEYRWKIEGVYSYSSTKPHTFTLPAGVHEQTYSVELRVRNNINLYNTKTITVTVKRPQRVYHLKDHIGNVRTSVDVEGNVLGHDDYYAFGLSMPGAHSSNTSNPNDNYKFTGHERDDEAGLTIDYMKARNYDPIIGRFQQVDPLAQKFPSISPYIYTFNNPINLWDPDGRAPALPMPYEPNKGQAGTINQAKQSIKNHFGGNKPTLQELRYTTGDGGGGKQVGPFGGSDGVRYIYTEKRGWIDLAHFFQVAAGAESNLGNGLKKAIAAHGAVRGMVYQELWEKTEEVENAQTGETQWSYEDGPSNAAGLDFFLDYYSEGGDLVEAITRFFNDAGATSPENAPNYTEMQESPQKQRRFKQNKSLKPVSNPEKEEVNN